MASQKFDLNPQLLITQSQSYTSKNIQKIGKIYNKSIFMESMGSNEPLSLKKNSSLVQYREEILLGAESPLARNHNLHFQFSRLDESILSPQNNNSALLQINPITNRSFRINKIYSSETSNFSKKKKTPQLIGKLSSSKLNHQPNSQDFDLQSFNPSKNRSPGYLTNRINFRRGAKQSIAPINSPEISRFMQFIDRNLKTSNNFSQTEFNPQNQRLIKEVKEKQLHLKKMIERRKKADSQNPVPYKNIQQFKYHYPVSKNSSKLQISNKTSPYLQKIEQNSKIFQGNLASPKFLSKVKEATAKSSAESKERQKFDDSQKILEKSWIGQMRIIPSVNVSFTIKSPRKNIQYENKKSFAHKQAENEVLGWRENISRVSMYSFEKNSNFNNRKPKFVSMLIDPKKTQLEKNSEIKTKKEIDLSFLSHYFSRQLKGVESEGNSQVKNFITLKTSVSFLKQLLIQSTQTSLIQLCVPSALFENQKMNTSVQIKDLHLFIKKIYQEMRIKPEIVTIRRYKNAIFTGVYQSSTKEFNFFSSIIYHFSGDIYVGGWKESRNLFSMDKEQVEGCKNGIGLQILYETVQKEENLFEENKIEPIQIQVDIYYGQFDNNKKQGYGIRFQTKFIDSKVSSQTTEIGCWADDQKHGWIKFYRNDKLWVNAEYEKGIKSKQRSLGVESVQKCQNSQQ